MRALASLRQGYVPADPVLTGLVILAILAVGMVFFVLRVRRRHDRTQRKESSR